MSTPPIEVAQAPRVDIAFGQAADLLDSVVQDLTPADWDLVSPCAGWTVRDVVGHATGTLATAAAMVRGRQSDRDDQPGDLGGWTQALISTRAVLAEADLHAPTEGPQGTKVVADALVFPTADLAVHAWDISRAVGRDLELPAGLLAHVVTAISTVPEEGLRRPGLFGPAQPVPDDADDTTKVMAWLGRTVI